MYFLQEILVKLIIDASRNELKIHLLGCLETVHLFILLIILLCCIIGLDFHEGGENWASSTGAGVWRRFYISPGILSSIIMMIKKDE